MAELSRTRSLKKIMRISYTAWCQVRDSEVQMLASSLAFTTVVSIVPLLAVSLSVFNAYGGFEFLIARIEPFLLQNLVEASGTQASQAIRRSIERVHSGALGGWGVVGILFVSTKLFHDMETAVHHVWRIKSTRSFTRKLIVYWGIMFLGPIVLAGFLGLMTSRDIGLIDVLPKGLTIFTLTFATFTAVYKLIPSRHVSWFSSLIAAASATAAVALAQSFYAQLTTKIFRYNKIYGSLASVPIFLIWILILWWICLLGVALSAVLENDREERQKNEIRIA